MPTGYVIRSRRPVYWVPPEASPPAITRRTSWASPVRTGPDRAARHELGPRGQHQRPRSGAAHIVNHCPMARALRPLCQRIVPGTDFALGEVVGAREAVTRI